MVGAAMHQDELLVKTRKTDGDMGLGAALGRDLRGLKDEDDIAVGNRH
jgi:hypothetical protein